MSDSKIKDEVKKSYGSLAMKRSIPLEAVQGGIDMEEKLLRYGYSKEELASLPASVVVMSDGCGNPTGLGMVEEGETVLDLGSGGGIDVFLASRRVGPRGRVVGLDMTPEMVQKAGANAKRMNLANVEFRLGEIESLPLDDGTVDVIISNCVICLSADKGRVFREMFRVLKPGGRVAIADEVALREFTPEEKGDPTSWCSCITGAITEDAYAEELRSAGFADVYVKRLRAPGELNPDVFSAFISAKKP